MPWFLFKLSSITTIAILRNGEIVWQTRMELAGSRAMKEIKSENDQFQIDPRTIYEHCPISNDKRRIYTINRINCKFTDTTRQLSREKKPENSRRNQKKNHTEMNELCWWSSFTIIERNSLRFYPFQLSFISILPLCTHGVAVYFWPCWKSLLCGFFVRRRLVWNASKPRFPPTFAVLFGTSKQARSHFGRVLFTSITISMTWLRCGVRIIRRNSIISNGWAVWWQSRPSPLHLRPSAALPVRVATLDFIRRAFLAGIKWKFDSIYSKCQ